MNSKEEIKSNVRYIAVKILSRFDRSDSYIDILLNNALRDNDLSQTDKALLTEIVNGVVRWRLKIDYVLIGFYRGDYQKCLNLVKNALRIALYQLLYLDKIPDYAAINESVEIIKYIQGEKTGGLVNGILRNIARNIEKIHYPTPGGDFHYYLGIIYSHPKWMAKRFCAIMGDDEASAFMGNNNKKPYTAIRINNLNSNMEEITEVFDKHEITYEKSKFLDNSLKLSSLRWDISQSEMFSTGQITVQDPAASLAVKLAAPKPDTTVIDVCSAPGGKSFYLAELMENKGKLLAMDIHPHKLRHIEKGAKRLGLDIIKPFIGDAKTIEMEEKVDMVFADVPCSGFGTIRKKPGIKWKREHNDIKILADMQYEIMENTIKLLKDGGVFIYSTCTVDPEENEDNVNKFLKNHPEFVLDNAENYLPKEICSDGMMKILPHKFDTDGAFAARLIKKVKKT